MEMLVRFQPGQPVHSHLLIGQWPNGKAPLFVRDNRWLPHSDKLETSPRLAPAPLRTERAHREPLFFRSPVPDRPYTHTPLQGSFWLKPRQLPRPLDSDELLPSRNAMVATPSCTRVPPVRFRPRALVRSPLGCPTRKERLRVRFPLGPPFWAYSRMVKALVIPDETMASALERTNYRDSDRATEETIHAKSWFESNSVPIYGR